MLSHEEAETMVSPPRRPGRRATAAKGSPPKQPSWRAMTATMSPLRRPSRRTMVAKATGLKLGIAGQLEFWTFGQRRLEVTPGDKSREKMYWFRA